MPERRRPARPEGGAEGFRAQDGERRPRDFSGARPQQPGAGYGNGADGSGAGAAVQFATLTTKPELTVWDFVVVA